MIKVVAYILVKETMAVPNTGELVQIMSIKNLFKTCVPFTDSISKINNTQINNAKDIDVVMFINLI